LEEFGLFAKKLIPSGTIIKYWGVSMDPEKRCKSKYGLQVFKSLVIDGDPFFVEQFNLPTMLNIAAYINEPNADEKPNAELRMNKNYFVTIREIQKGEEILANYGSRYCRDYKKGTLGKIEARKDIQDKKDQSKIIDLGEIESDNSESELEYGSSDPSTKDESPAHSDSEDSSIVLKVSKRQFKEMMSKRL
jgi:hypothetical protein